MGPGPTSAHPVLAVGLALCSAFLYALAAALQRLGAGRVADERSGTFFGDLALQPVWWCGVASMAAGAAIHVVALGLASVTLVQPVGVLALVLALPLDARLERRTVTRPEWTAAAVLVAGLGGLLALAPHRGDPRPAPTSGLVGTVVTAVVVLAVIAGVGMRLPRGSRAVCRAAGAGLCAGTTSGLVRPVLHGLRHGLDVGVLTAGVGVLVLPVLGLLLLQTAYRDGGLDAGLATQTTVDPVVAGAIGIAVLGERFTGGPGGAALGVGCALVTVAGLVWLIRAGPGGGVTRRADAAAPTSC
ncbi:DMT family transporter [Actinomycetospora termitidis]|uniref:DMT family transporter n=1 Tax=Actinomycetospora termitidis TaxID=3053470 RepID=A0ABT7MAM1_9PSEU|nr:DMT family transporter [Actinomycetospora sp. Odt1-22]MDL5157703.1 DMT family transporter [Actinomycetospora sp. Odt1-22]